MSAPHVGPRDVDRAALLGAALAAVVALTFGGAGEWEWMASAAGVALLAVIAAFFRLPTGPPRRWAARAEIAAVSAVAALAVALVIATPLQVVLSTTPIGERCRASAAVAAAQVLLDEDRRRAADQATARLAAEGSPLSGPEALGHAAEDEHRTVLGLCIGAATTRWLPLPAAVAAVLIFVVAGARTRRARRSTGEPNTT